MPPARGLEGTCWLAAVILALALILGNQKAAPAPAILAAASPTPQLSIYEQRCIERVLARIADRSEEEVAARINQDCFAPRRARPTGARPGPFSCGRLFIVRVTPAAQRIEGCLGG